MALLLGFPLSTLGTTPKFSDFLGTWKLQIDHANLFVVQLDGSESKPQGAFWRPKGLEMTNNVFHVTDSQADKYVLVKTETKGDQLRLTFRDDRKDEMKFYMERRGDKVELGISDVPPEAGIGPWALERAPRGATVSNTWNADRAYIVGDDDMPNPEIGRLYAQDQADRSRQPIDMKKMTANDAVRRERTRALDEKGLLHTGKDFKEAAFIMQHGVTPDDYLMAHSLAIVAVSKGEPTAVWIAAASLDRYLWSKGQPQIYGTQTKTDASGKPTDEPYDQNALPVSLKTQLGILPGKR